MRRTSAALATWSRGGAAVLASVALAVTALALASPALASPARAASSRERFTLISHQATAQRPQVRASGVLTASGHALVRPVVAGKTTTWLTFSRGSLRLVMVVHSQSASVPDPSTCKFTETIRGSYTIRGGARAYRKATGAGGYKTRIVGRLAMLADGSCGTQLASFWQGTYTWGTLRR